MSPLDPTKWSLVCVPSGIVYAQRATAEELRRLFEEQRELVLKFGAPRLDPPDVRPLDLAVRRKGGPGAPSGRVRAAKGRGRASARPKR